MKKKQLTKKGNYAKNTGTINFVGTYVLQRLCTSFECEFSQHSSENSVRPGPDHTFYELFLCYAAENSASWQHWRPVPGAAARRGGGVLSGPSRAYRER